MTLMNASPLRNGRTTGFLIGMGLILFIFFFTDYKQGDEVEDDD
nr:hypothetical protein [Evansella caseinilytica]